MPPTSSQQRDDQSIIQTDQFIDDTFKFIQTDDASGSGLQRQVERDRKGGHVMVVIEIRRARILKYLSYRHEYGGMTHRFAGSIVAIYERSSRYSDSNGTEARRSQKYTEMNDRRSSTDEQNRGYENDAFDTDECPHGTSVVSGRTSQHLIYSV
jgi:hypothetical protein